MANVRVAMIGAGGLASRYHYPSLASLPDVSLEAVCDLVVEKADQAAARWSIPRVYTDYRRMLDEVEPDAVCVIMPPQHLYEPVVQCLKRKRHVFIEKPPGLTLVQTQSLAYHAAENGCIGMAGFQRRYIPALTALKRRIEDRSPINHASVAFLKRTGDFTQLLAAWDGLLDMFTSDGIHAVDNVRFLCGGDVVAVSSDIRRRFIPGHIPNAFTALITFSTGATGVMQYIYTTGRRIFRAEFHGRDMTGYVDADRESYLAADGAEPEIVSSQSYGEPDRPETWLGFWHQAREFVDCVRNGRQPHNNFADAVKTMDLVDRIQHAAMPT